MSRWTVRNANLGFTLAEISVTLLIIGVLAAVGIPNFLQMYRRFQANSAFDQVRGAIQEAQLQAIRLGKTCNLTINETNKTIAVSNATADKGCLLKTLTLPTSTTIKSNNGTLVFDFQGNPPVANLQTIVVSNNSQNYNKCLVISNVIGIMRSGNYTGNLNNTIVGSSCDTQ